MIWQATLPGLALGASTVSVDLGFLGILGGFIVAVIGAFAVWRKIEPERRKLQAEADRLAQEAEQIEDSIRRSLMDEIAKDREAARRETAEARADAQAARADTLAAQDELRVQLSLFERARHGYELELREKNSEIRALRTRVDTLAEKVKDLTIALEIEQGRRADDAVTGDRLGVLERRAEVSELKAEHARERADDAAESAVEQELRNDDTPGHA